MTRRPNKSQDPWPTPGRGGEDRIGRRWFQLTLAPSHDDGFGVTLSECLEIAGPSIEIAAANPAQTARVLDEILACVRASGLGTAALTFAKNDSVPLDEAAGVRLALVILATTPLTKHERVRAIASGINAMSLEETYYWYSKCVGDDASRAQRALRLLLADD